MKKLLAVAVLFTAFSFTSLGADAREQEQSCFATYHEIFHDHYGGINLDNIDLFNNFVLECQIYRG
ncbi:hypothetical protein [Haloflavibacter putidus]|uniref:Uncharacterized protein n=1 Tax=Haloflavibacter putidus TaxID=2576776 RepID=A0A507ZWQ0_9FLAO|nr:hypothetical protein [Haloflavibacter putidus]TQD40694.1 hypothetical protein FKR84_01560 [Haloflavibacter putidus]